MGLHIAQRHGQQDLPLGRRRLMVFSTKAAQRRQCQGPRLSEQESPIGRAQLCNVMRQKLILAPKEGGQAAGLKIARDIERGWNVAAKTSLEICLPQIQVNGLMVAPDDARGARPDLPTPEPSPS